MTGLFIKSLSSGGVITNYHCVSRCGHCLYNCGPHRNKDYLDPDLAEKIFTVIATFGCRSVHIGGGEPLLNPAKLLAVLDSARKVGIKIDYVETNSAWFVDLKKAQSLLKNLQDLDVYTILVSISPFHNAFVPFDRVMGVIEACRQMNMNVFPWVNAFVRDLSRLDTHSTHTMEEFKAAYGKNYLKCIPDRYWIHLGGRALETFQSVYPQYSLEQILAQSPASCARALSDTSHFHFDLYGNYIPGLCSGLALDMNDLKAGLPAGKYTLLDQLTATGVRGLFKFASRTYNYVPSKRTFLNHCDLCTDIRNFLLHLKTEIFPELEPEDFYS